MLDKPSKKTSIKAVALRTLKGSYYVPGKKNSFDDLEFENVLFDSGCASLLLPFPQTMTFEIFLQKYHKFPWSLGISAGKELFNSCTLHIDKGTFPEFTIKLDGAQEDLKTDFLRFHISFNEAEAIVKHAKEKLSSKEIETVGLDAFVINKNREMIPQLKFGLPRRDVLLGQTILRKVPFIQFNNMSTLRITLNGIAL